MNDYAIRVVGFVGMAHRPETVAGSIGKWVKSYDPDAHGGEGEATYTSDPSEARTFPTVEAATLFYRQVSSVKPTRPGGKPNRPLTAATIEIARLP